MRRQFSLLGFLLAVSVTFIAVIASTAQANPPELLPAKAQFTFTSSGTTTLLTLTAKKVECEKVTGTGEVGANESLGTVEFKFVGCTTTVLGLKVKCTGLEAGDKEGEILFGAEWHLRHLLINNAPEHVSLMILPGHVHWECAGVLFLVLGSVCSDDLLTKENGSPSIENLLLASVYADFLIEGTSGDPVVKEVDTNNSLGMEKCELLAKEGTSETNKYATAAQGGAGTITASTPSGTLLIELVGTN